MGAGVSADAGTLSGATGVEVGSGVLPVVAVGIGVGVSVGTGVGVGEGV